MTNKIQISNSKKTAVYDLEPRTAEFAFSCRNLIKQLKRNVTNIEYAKQLARSSGSVAANYIEANEALSKKDFVYRVRIVRKEVKESGLWLRLIEIDKVYEQTRMTLLKETIELSKIMSRIITNSTAK